MSIIANVFTKIE
ncbi:Protein of unknown function [Bacillus toyonensis]|uniref:Uncharacterized protein n=3 Tax=Bacillus cereus group TaxID=86661 RepID=A0A1C6WIJ4_9BACI|nr:Protein of unknown function [Bacillus mobilis]SCC04808.1 Protein of unknown function [Bacillus wiedmannii]SCC05855.1 Protein of unknown function [Bacillus cereus]SCC06386.1 Protein of unknown function [Bacillus thuringiensis]SCM86235.1 Protein of unknown function [Bacillus mycoides]SCN15454.1 Protein of unknown function [Bacillus toyonensis]